MKRMLFRLFLLLGAIAWLFVIGLLVSDLIAG